MCFHSRPCRQLAFIDVRCWSVSYSSALIPPRHPTQNSPPSPCAHASVILSLPAAAFWLLARVRPGPHSFENQMALYICSPNYWTVIWTWVMGEMDRRLTLIDLHKEPLCRRERRGGIYFKRISLSLALFFLYRENALAAQGPSRLPATRSRSAPLQLSSCCVPLEPRVLSCSS